MNSSKTIQLFSALALALIVGSIEQTLAFRSPDKPPTPSFDKRRDALPAVQLTAERQQAAVDLQARLPGVRIDYDKITGTPAWISTLAFLSRPTVEEIQRTGALGLPADDPHRAVKAFLIENAALFGHGPEVLTGAAITREFLTEHNGMRTVVWQQQLEMERYEKASG